ncbi:MAG TPA: LuxR C-terminal-related transcriptional regulator [Nitrospiraceae bacterium]|nr:LuxR C-terminal-related transcriptional regulator [Nitrospiraceae bacterium]
MAFITPENIVRPVVNGRKQSQGLRQQGATGVILFTSTGQLLFMNAEAQAFTRQLQPLLTRENGTCLIPEQIHSIVHDLIGHLMRCNHPKDCESIQVERLCFVNDQRLLLRGFCIPDEPLARNSRFLVIVEQLNHQRLECPDANMQQRYHLTEREQMVIIYLMLGFTNKEIANRINLSEYTVKEHLKRIMHKTQTTTRTGLLARMIFPTPDGAVPEVLSGSREVDHHFPHIPH